MPKTPLAVLRSGLAELEDSGKGGRDDDVAPPWPPDILRKQTAHGAYRTWEARPERSRAELPPGEHEVTALDINGACLSALKTHLPLGRLEHSTGNHHDRRRVGIHLITTCGGRRTGPTTRA